MARYLVDTTVLIDLSKGIIGTRRQIDDLLAGGAELGVCAINIAEFASGIPSGQMPLWHDLLGAFRFWGISRETAELAGAYRHTLFRRGTTLQVADAIVAAVAATLDATILTDNVRHFLLVSDVRVRSLR